MYNFHVNTGERDIRKAGQSCEDDIIHRHSRGAELVDVHPILIMRDGIL